MKTHCQNKLVTLKRGVCELGFCNVLLYMFFIVTLRRFHHGQLLSSLIPNRKYSDKMFFFKQDAYCFYFIYSIKYFVVDSRFFFS